MPQEADGDLTVQTALVEARLIVGNYPLFSRMVDEFKKHLDPQTFYHTKRVEQEERYRTFIDSTDDAVFLRDEQGRYVIVNEAMANLRFDACMLRRGVETTDTAVLVIDKDRRPVSLNAQAEHLIAERRTLGLAASGAIAFPDARVNGWLTGCIAGRTRLG